ncbi:extracellular metallo proteinase mep [Peziza echinospora]|nr:extracellular metallo proteinase mep [Peziza echinospora]
MRPQFLLLLAAITTALAHRQHLDLPVEQVGSTYFDSTHHSSTLLPVRGLSASAVLDPLTIAQSHLEALHPSASYRLSKGHYTDADTGITHAYFVQTYNGIDIENAQVNVNVMKDGTILSAGSSFLNVKLQKVKRGRRAAQLDPAEALRGVFESLGLPGKAGGAEAVRVESGFGADEEGEKYLITGVEGVLSDPTAHLRWYQTPEGELKLIWRLESDFGENWLVLYADAEDKGVVHGSADYVADAQYLVYPLGVNDPTDGDRVLLTNPHNTATSPNGWHASSDGTKYTTLRGNNGIAQENWDGGSDYLDNYRPDGGADLTFSFPYPAANSTDPKSYIDAALTQLFYTSNIYHDLLESLGFTEVAGNFEEINTGEGGLGGDAVQLNAQDGAGTNNANFATPVDGQRPRMRMYIWTDTTPYRDGDLELGIILHEYTHGLSNRLTGGPANSACLSTTEAGGMGEGWSDAFPTVIRIKPADTRTKDYGMGDWAANGGIRVYPYSTSLTTNPITFESLNTAQFSAVHSIGNVWATFIYELAWNLIEKHGNERDIFPTYRANSQVPEGGRALTLKLMLEGMKLQPCRPTFTDARNAIVDADKAVTGGENQCEIWRAFAKRGLGVDASVGNGTRTRVNGFKVPEGCEGLKADVKAKVGLKGRSFPGPTRLPLW